MRIFFIILSLSILTEAAITAIGSTGTLDRAKKFQDRVAVPGHDDSQAWTSSIDLGASFTRGNSDTMFITASFTIDRDFGKNEFFGNATYAYGEDGSTVTEDELIIMASLSRLLTSDELWYFGGRIDGTHDDLADISYRFIMSTFFGHYLVKRPDDSLSISIEGGVGLTTESQGDDNSTYPIFYAGERFNYWLTDFTRLYQGIAIFDEMERPSSFVIVGEAGIETFLSDSLSFKAYAQNRFDSEPAQGRKKNDLRIVSGLSYKF